MNNGGIMVQSLRSPMAREAERVLRTIFRRCVECDTTTPPCPKCDGNQICSLVPANCDSCARMVCVDNPNPPAQAPAGPNIAAIAGGVVGGVAFVCIVVFLVWFLWIRKRRAQQEAEAEEWDEDEIAQQKAAFQNMVHDAASTRTRGSFANSVLSRASNVIQIAFIPGVTTRNGSSHTLDSTPVPPVPAARNTPRGLNNQNDAIFFRPGDIRDSSYSGTSSIFNPRDTQYTVSSRDSSIEPSSIYQSGIAIQPLPAAQAARAVPRMVSVKSSNTGSSTDSPSAYSQSSAGANKGVQIVMPGQGAASSGSMRSQGSFGKAQQITVGGKNKGRFPVKTAVDSKAAVLASNQHAPDVSSPLRDANNDSDTDGEDDSAGANKSLLKITPPPEEASKDNPFFDPADATAASQSETKPNPYASLASTISTANNSPPKRGKSMGGLSAVIEEATKKASSPPLRDGLGGKRDSSPFDDSNKIE